MSEVIKKSDGYVKSFANIDEKVRECFHEERLVPHTRCGTLNPKRKWNTFLLTAMVYLFFFRNNHHKISNQFPKYEKT